MVPPTLPGPVNAVHVSASECRHLEHNIVATLQMIASTRPLVSAKLAGVARMHCNVHCIYGRRRSDALQDYLAIAGIIDATHNCSRSVLGLDRKSGHQASLVHRRQAHCRGTREGSVESRRSSSRKKGANLPYVKLGREDGSGSDALLAALGQAAGEAAPSLLAHWTERCQGGTPIAILGPPRGSRKWTLPEGLRNHKTSESLIMTCSLTGPALPPMTKV